MTSLEIKKPIILGDRSMSKPRLAQTKEEAWAEKLEPPHRKIVPPRDSQGTYSSIWKFPKEDSRDLSPENLPSDVSAPGVFDALVETLILNIWGDVAYQFTSKRRSYLIYIIRDQMWPAFEPLLEHPTAQMEILALMLQRYGRYCFLPFPREALQAISERGWSLPLTLDIVRLLWNLRVQGVLEDGWLTPILERLAFWFPRILARLEELAREPGDNSQRLLTAIQRMRTRIAEIDGMKINLASTEAVHGK